MNDYTREDEGILEVLGRLPIEATYSSIPKDRSDEAIYEVTRDEIGTDDENNLFNVVPVNLVVEHFEELPTEVRVGYVRSDTETVCLEFENRLINLQFSPE